MLVLDVHCLRKVYTGNGDTHPGQAYPGETEHGYARGEQSPANEWKVGLKGAASEHQLILQQVSCMVSRLLYMH